MSIDTVQHRRPGPGVTGRATVDDVARLAGVSRQTVSRTVNASGAVAGPTRARVLACVEALGYVPDPVAQSLGRYRRGQPPEHPHLPPGCLEAIATLRAAGLAVHLHHDGAAVEVAVDPLTTTEETTVPAPTRPVARFCEPGR